MSNVSIRSAMELKARELANLVAARRADSRRQLAAAEPLDRAVQAASGRARWAERM